MTILGGGAIGPAADLYSGEILLDRDTLVDLETHYVERMELPLEARAGLRLDFTREHLFHLLIFRGRFGRSETTARYSGGAGAATVERSATWWGVDVVGGLLLAESGRFAWEGRAGLTWTRWHLDSSGPGRFPLDPRVPEAVTWSDRIWSSWGGIFGFGFRYRLPSGLSAALEIAQRLTSVNAVALRTADQEDLDRSFGVVPPLRYDGYIALPRTVSLTIGWTFE